MKLSLTTFAVIVAVIIVLAGLYYLLIVKGGSLAVALPKSLQINKTEIASQPRVDAGSVLGESEPYDNPLRDIYVNPFSK